MFYSDLDGFVSTITTNFVRFLGCGVYVGLALFVVRWICSVFPCLECAGCREFVWLVGWFVCVGLGVSVWCVGLFCWMCQVCLVR